jgi:hypothetical protein
MVKKPGVKFLFKSFGCDEINIWGSEKRFFLKDNGIKNGFCLPLRQISNNIVVGSFLS